MTDAEKVALLRDAVGSFLGFTARGHGRAILERMNLAKYSKALQGYLWHIDALKSALEDTK